MKTNLSNPQSFQKHNVFSRWWFVCADRPTVSHTFLLPLARCKSVFVLICPLKVTRERKGALVPLVAGGTDKLLFTSSRRTLVSQASRREFVLHCTLVILRNANLKTEIILVVIVQYVTTFVVLLLGEQKVFGVGWAGDEQPLAS